VKTSFSRRLNVVLITGQATASSEPARPHLTQVRHVCPPLFALPKELAAELQQAPILVVNLELRQAMGTQALVFNGNGTSFLIRKR